MKLKYRLQTIIKFFQLAFYPKATIMACLLVGLVFDAILGLAMYRTDSEDIHDFLFALITGVTASFIVSIIVALSTNYRNNKLAWYELREYHNAVLNYENRMRTFSESQDIYNEYYQNTDSITATWIELPTIIPVFDDVLKSKKAFLADAEINSLNSIMSEYEIIKGEIGTIVENDLLYNSLNHPDETFVKQSFPQTIWEDIPGILRHHLLLDKNRDVSAQLVDEVLNDKYLLSFYMKDYDISQKAIDSYSLEEEVDEDNEIKIEDINDYVFDDHTEMDEEQFRAYTERWNNVMIEEMKPFVSWSLSSSCFKIAQEIEALEMVIKKKPYVGTMLKLSKTIETE